MKCTTCGTVILKRKNPNSKNVFCNHGCYAKFKQTTWQGEKNPRWNGGDDKKKCQICQKEFTRKKYGDRKNKYCSIKCATKDRAKNQKLEKHWNWKGGNNSRALKKIAPRPRPDKCEVCGNKGKKRNGIVLDHNHKTGKFRGWLCSNCNTAIGLLNEDPKRFDLLKAYIISENSL